MKIHTYFTLLIILSSFFLFSFVRLLNLKISYAVWEFFFFLYEMSRSFYNDYEMHFDSDMIRIFFKTKKINQKFSSSKSSKNTDMIEMKNRLLKSILRKKNLKWNLAFVFSIMKFNNRIIHHFDMSFSIIFFKNSLQSDVHQFHFISYFWSDHSVLICRNFKFTITFKCFISLFYISSSN